MTEAMVLAIHLGVTQTGARGMDHLRASIQASTATIRATLKVSNDLAESMREPAGGHKL